MKNNQQKIALTIGYFLVSTISFGLGGVVALKNKPEVQAEQLPLTNNTTIECKIKGNINTKGARIYHMPDGAFYKQTNPEQCFETEEQAQAAGFTKSSR
ncbi:MAG: hypothetical protein HY545_00190 [Candidatus Doudnabacteria bacterium]|nr:hypothetical protein [Candidatus Doudnabacteria bacterium]